MAILMNINQEIVSNYMLLAVSWCLEQAEVFSNCQPYFSHICSLFNRVKCNDIKIKVYGIYLGVMCEREVVYMNQIFQYRNGKRSSNIG